MDIEFLGGNCFRVKTKSTTIIFDDNLEKIGAKSPQSDKTVAFYTNPELHSGVKTKSRLMIDSPGEFEVGDITVTGLQVRGHMDEEGKLSSTVYQCMFEGQTVTILGHIHPDMSSELSELASGTEVLVTPVGGNGYTLDPAGAVSVVKALEPDVVIPSHYELPGFNYEVPAQPVAEFVKVMSADMPEPSDSFNTSKGIDGSGSGQTKVVVLSVKK